MSRLPFFALILCSLGTRAVAADAASFQWTDHPETGACDLVFGDKPVLRYMYAYDDSTKETTAETYKVFHHVFAPGTGELITKGPGGLYTHHRGLFVGWMRTRFSDKQIDTWHCKDGVHQRHVRFVDRTADGMSAKMIAEIHWNDGEAKPVMTEARSVAVKNIGEPGKPPVWQIDWSTKLESRRGEIELSGDRQHAGFQFRAAQAVAETASAQYLRPEGFPQQPVAYEVDDRGNPPKHIDLGWLAMTFVLGDARHTVEYFEDPSLPRPSLYSERPYGRFGAYFKTTLTEQKPLVMRYRLVVATGPSPQRRAIQKRYDEFVKELGERR